MKPEDLPDTRTRLGYVVRKSGEAADRVLNAVEQAKAEQQHIAAAVAELRAAAAGTPLEAAAERVALSIKESSDRTNDQLTDIMLAQDFHDLIGQVVAKVAKLVTGLEENLAGLLDQAPPSPASDLRTSSALAGPFIEPNGGTDVLIDQAEVDALLAKTAF
ncbi:MAG: protein phosphatase CheZ [Betaproteobacteria bacterium]|jgi:chemotaxis protein CheZ